MLNPSIISLAFGLACTQCYAQVPVCTVTPNKATLAPNEILILTASCAPAATSFVWTGLGIPSMTAVPSVLATAPLTGSYVYTVTGVNASGQSQVSSTTITVGGAAVVTPPSPPNNSHS